MTKWKSPLGQSVLAAIKVFDETARRMDRKWGHECLERMVSPDTAAKWATARGKMHAAMEEEKLDRVLHTVNVCVRGFEKMDREADAAGAQPISDALIPITVNGKAHYLMVDDRAWPAVKANRPDIEGGQLVSIGEVQRALEVARMDHPTVRSVKDAFPGAHVTDLKPPRSALAVELDDEIPW